MIERNVNEDKLKFTALLFGELFGRVRSDANGSMVAREELDRWEKFLNQILDQIDPYDSSFTLQDVAEVFLALLKNKTVMTPQGQAVETRIRGVSASESELPPLSEVRAVFEEIYDFVVVYENIEQLVAWAVEYRFRFAKWYYLLIKKEVSSR